MVLSKRQGEQEQDVSGTGYVLFEFVNADVVEQVDTGDLKSSGLSRAGSSPVIRTIQIPFLCAAEMQRLLLQAVK